MKLKIPGKAFRDSDFKNTITGIFNFAVGILVINEIIPVDIIVFTDTRVIEQTDI